MTPRQSIIKQGPCAFCGGPYAAHRVIDAEMGRVASGDPIEDVAAEYRNLSVREMVASWMALMGLLHSSVLRTRRKQSRLKGSS